MFRQQLAGLALLLAVTAGAVAADRLFQKEPEPELPVCAVVAPLEGEITSPDGQFYVRQMGADTSVTAAGLYPAERIQVVSRKTGEVLWEDIGYYHQSVLWSPGSRYAAIARRARTYQVVTVIDTHTFLAWDVTLPDGGPIPEYTFLPEDDAWGTWQNENTLLLTVGLGGDSGPRRFYRYASFRGGPVHRQYAGADPAVPDRLVGLRQGRCAGDCGSGYGLVSGGDGGLV